MTVCRIPKPEEQIKKYGRDEPYKWPKLAEALMQLVPDATSDGAHDAGHDALAAATIWHRILGLAFETTNWKWRCNHCKLKLPFQGPALEGGSSGICACGCNDWRLEQTVFG